MYEQIEAEKKSPYYVKCTITEELDEALKTLEEKIDITRASVVRAALHEHIMKHYPDYLPKSKREIMNEVKKNFYFEKFNQEFVQAEYIKTQIPDTEGYIEKTKNDIITYETKYTEVVKKIKEIDPKNKSKLEKLQSEKSYVEKNLKHLKKILKDDEKRLEDYKKGITDGTPM